MRPLESQRAFAADSYVSFVSTNHRKPDIASPQHSLNSTPTGSILFNLSVPGIFIATDSVFGSKKNASAPNGTATMGMNRKYHRHEARRKTPAMVRPNTLDNGKREVHSDCPESDIMRCALRTYLAKAPTKPNNANFAFCAFCSGYI